jgi:hypothetical protein
VQASAQHQDELCTFCMHSAAGVATNTPPHTDTRSLPLKPIQTQRYKHSPVSESSQCPVVWRQVGPAACRHHHITSARLAAAPTQEEPEVGSSEARHVQPPAASSNSSSGALQQQQ